nr:hypothetical protein Itr_chr11CG17840 [Ipomoea trifida]GLL47941.1 hypothetical protein Itr_chr14CG27160 [Ipomoea trifida]
MERKVRNQRNGFRDHRNSPALRSAHNFKDEKITTKDEPPAPKFRILELSTPRLSFIPNIFIRFGSEYGAPEARLTKCVDLVSYSVPLPQKSTPFTLMPIGQVPCGSGLIRLGDFCAEEEGEILLVEPKPPPFLPEQLRKFRVA